MSTTVDNILERLQTQLATYLKSQGVTTVPAKAFALAEEKGAGLNPIEQAKALHNMISATRTIWTCLKESGISNIGKEEKASLDKIMAGEASVSEKFKMGWKFKLLLTKAATLSKASKQTKQAGEYLDNASWLPLVAHKDSLEMVDQLHTAFEGISTLLAQEQCQDSALGNIFTSEVRSDLKDKVDQYYVDPLQEMHAAYTDEHDYLANNDTRQHEENIADIQEKLSEINASSEILFIGTSTDEHMGDLSEIYSAMRAKFWGQLASLTKKVAELSNAYQKSNLPETVYLNPTMDRPEDALTNTEYLDGVQYFNLGSDVSQLEETCQDFHNKFLKLEESFKPNENESPEDISEHQTSVQSLLDDINNIEPTALEAQESITPIADQEIPDQVRDDSDDDQFVDAVEDLDTAYNVQEMSAQGRDDSDDEFVDAPSSFSEVTQALESAEAVAPDASAEVHEIPGQDQDENATTLSKNDVAAIHQQLYRYQQARKGVVADYLSESRHEKLQIVENLLVRLDRSISSDVSNENSTLTKAQVSDLLNEAKDGNNTAQGKSYFFSSKPDTLGKLLEAEASKLRPGNR